MTTEPRPEGIVTTPAVPVRRCTYSTAWDRGPAAGCEPAWAAPAPDSALADVPQGCAVDTINPAGGLL